MKRCSTLLIIRETQSTDVRVGQQRRLSAKVVMFLKMLEKSLESPLYGKEIKPVNHDGNES